MDRILPFPTKDDFGVFEICGLNLWFIKKNSVEVPRSSISYLYQQVLQKKLNVYDSIVLTAIHYRYGQFQIVWKPICNSSKTVCESFSLLMYQYMFNKTTESW